MKKLSGPLLIFSLGISPVFSQVISADTISPAAANETVSDASTSRLYAPLFPQKKVLFSVAGELSSNSNAVPSAFSNAFLFPKFIDESLKQEAFGKLEPTNRFGAEYSTQGEFSFYPDSTWKAGSQFIRISFAQKQLFALQFSEDLFHVVFGGNADYADRTANFDNFSYYGISYQTLKAGFFKNIKTLTLGVSLGIARGLSHTDLRAKSASLYTEPAGQYLDVAFSGTYLESGIVNNQLHLTPSYGGLVDLYFVVKPGKGWNFIAEVQDLGFINWNERTSLSAKDTAFRFTGIQVEDLFHPGDSSIVLSDTLLSSLKGDEVTGVSMQALPATFRLSADRVIYGSWKAGVSAQYRYIPGYTVQYGLSLSKHFLNGMAVGVNAYYGGFGNLRTALQVTLLNNDRHYLTLGTMYNEGFINSKKAAGNGFMLRYSYSL